MNKTLTSSNQEQCNHFLRGVNYDYTRTGPPGQGLSLALLQFHTAQSQQAHLGMLLTRIRGVNADHTQKRSLNSPTIAFLTLWLSLSTHLPISV